MLGLSLARRLARRSRLVHPHGVDLFALFVVSVLLISGGAFLFITAKGQPRGGAAAAIGLGVLLLIIAVNAAANYNS